MMNKIKKALNFPFDILQMIIGYLPGPIGDRLRYKYWKTRLNYLGKNVRIDIGVHFQNPEFISIDENCWIDRNVIILAGKDRSQRIKYLKTNTMYKRDAGEVYIGKNTHIAPNCVLSGIGGVHIGNNCGVASNSLIYSFSHHYRNINNREDTWQYSFSPMARHDQQAMIQGAVYIGDYCAIGLSSVILPGTILKNGSWVSSGSVISGEYNLQTLLKNNHITNTISLEYLKIKV